MLHLRRGDALGEIKQVSIIRMDHPVHLAEGQVLVPTLVSEKAVERAGPVDPPAGDVPVPQAAAAAGQGGVHPPFHPGAGAACAASALRMGDADTAQAGDGQDHRDGGSRIGRAGALQSLDLGNGFHDRDLAAGKVPERRERVRSVPQPHAHRAGSFGQDRERLLLLDDIVDVGRCGFRGRMGGDHTAREVGEEEESRRLRGCRKPADRSLQGGGAEQPGSADAGQFVCQHREGQFRLRKLLRQGCVPARLRTQDQAWSEPQQGCCHECRADVLDPEGRRAEPPENGGKDEPRLARNLMQPCGNAGGVHAHASSPAHLAPVREDVPHLLESRTIESRRADLSRVPVKSR